MNRRKLQQLGLPPDLVRTALDSIRRAAESHSLRKTEIRQTLEAIIADPQSHTSDPHFAPLAEQLIEYHTDPLADKPPAPYKTWGADQIEKPAFDQMQLACSVPVAVSGALMPDAHLGYGLPVGGVLATENAIIPYAVGVDIACRMKLTILDTPTNAFDQHAERYRIALEKGTAFGVGVRFKKPKSHNVMDRDWTVSPVTQSLRDKAWQQLGTSGSGNHFVEFGLFTLNEADPNLKLQPGAYVALLSHSGSRGTGAAVCKHYSDIARSKLPKRFERYTHLAWLNLDDQAGIEYLNAMNLMGEYASANHHVIHHDVLDLLGAQPLATVENHHNFAWIERHHNRDLIVHRKGATPAGPGTLGIIPGSMATPAYLVRGKGNPESLNSASHGAGRLMSRTAAKQKFSFKAVKNNLAKQGVNILSAGADEVPGVYKDIDQIMQRQTDLVETLGRFDPKLVKMCGDGSRAED